MSLIGKNKDFYSYRNECRIGANFQYKDFEKTKSYNTNFSKSNFNYASLRAAQMKYCNFNEASFVETEFIGTNIKGSCFKGAIFKNAIFKSVVMDKTDFTGAELVNCIFCNTRFTNVKGLNISNSRIIDKCPELREYSQELLNTIQDLRANDIIRRSNTLHLKNNKINTLYLQELLGDFSQYELVVLLKLLPRYLTTQFYTLSYLKKLLTKIKKETTI